MDCKELIERHAAICNELGKLYAAKNADYGDSFHATYLEEGMAMPRIRLSDKLSRFKALTRSGRQQMSDESIRDTLLDLANYAIMTIMELDREEETCQRSAEQTREGFPHWQPKPSAPFAK